MTSGENNSGWKHLSNCFVLGCSGPLVPRHGCWLGLSPGQADEEELRQVRRCFCGLPWCVAGVAIAVYQYQAAVTTQEVPPGVTASWWHYARLLSSVTCALLALISIGTEGVVARQNTLYASCIVGCFINPCINALMMGQPLLFTMELVLQRLGATLSFGCLFFVFLGQVSLLLLVTVNLSFMFGVVMNAVFEKESVSDPAVPFERSLYPWLAIVCFGMLCYGFAALAKCSWLRPRATKTPRHEKCELSVMPTEAATDSVSAEVDAPSGRPVREAWAPS